MSYSDIFTSYKAVKNPNIDNSLEDFESPYLVSEEMSPLVSDLKFRNLYPDIVPPDESTESEIAVSEERSPLLKITQNTKLSKHLKGSELFEKAFLEALKIDPSIAKYKNFLIKTAKRESNFDSLIQNISGAPYYGYFLMGASEIKLTTGLSVKEFRNDPVKLILGAILLYKINLKTLKKIGAYDLGKSRGYSEEAMMAGAWMGGPGGVKKYLLGQGDPSDSHWYKKAGMEGGSSVGKIMNNWKKQESFKNGGLILKCGLGDVILKSLAPVITGVIDVKEKPALTKSSLRTPLSKLQYELAQDVWNYMIAKNVSPRNTAAVMGNIMQESSFNRNAKLIGGDNAEGFFLMHSDDLKAYNTWKSNNKTGKYPEIDYILYMIDSKDHPYTNEYRRVLKLPKTPKNLKYIQDVYGKRLRTNTLYLIDDLNTVWNDETTPLNDVTNLFTDTIERAGDPRYSNRLNYANDFYNHFYGVAEQK